MPNIKCNITTLSPSKDALYTRSPTLSIHSIYSEIKSCSSNFDLDSKKIEPRFKFGQMLHTSKSTSSLTSKPKINTTHQNTVQILKEIIKKTTLTKNYKLTQTELGAGISGVVHLVKRKADGRSFAAKLFNKRTENENETFYWERISNEIYISSILHNENCLKTIDLAGYKGMVVQITEYYPCDLVDIVENSISERYTIEQKEINKYFSGLVLGLQYLHSYGIGHRDIKLENLCISEDKQLKIIDFGSAKIFKAGLQTYLIKSTSLYGTGSYYAPELFDVCSRDIRKADVWSVGIVLMVLSQKKLPWQYSHVGDLEYKNYVSDRHSYLERIFNNKPLLDLLLCILDPCPDTRFSIDQVVRHPAFIEMLSDG